MRRSRAILIWAAVAVAVVAPVAIAATSPLLAWRDPFYIAAGFAGVIAMGLLLLQPLLAGGYLPGAGASRGRRFHAWIGVGVLAAVVVHVAGLWVSSPPDVIDALLFRSPTPFSAWGVVAMWAVFATALLAATWRRFRLPPRVWRIAHLILAAVIVLGGVVHALLIEGTMETLSKAAICLLVVAATLKLMLDIRSRRKSTRRRAPQSA
ncbi:MAG: ferric reductase-like transmembrane domain-containing protein [Pseudomonadota bacterium]